jgi:hypothetical protein
VARFRRLGSVHPTVTPGLGSVHPRQTPRLGSDFASATAGWVRTSPVRPPVGFGLRQRDHRLGSVHASATSKVRAGSVRETGSAASGALRAISSVPPPPSRRNRHNRCDPTRGHGSDAGDIAVVFWRTVHLMLARFAAFFFCKECHGFADSPSLLRSDWSLLGCIARSTDSCTRMTITKTPDALKFSYRFALLGVKDEGGCGLCGLLRLGISRRSGILAPRPNIQGS